MGRFSVAALLATVAMTQTPAQMPSEARVAIDAYRTAIEAGSGTAKPGALEAALDHVDALREILMHVRDDGSTLLEAFSDAEFQRVQQSLAGVLINREEVVFVAADPDYFSRLAGSAGDVSDRAFFKAFKLTYPNGVWPSYETQQTDYSGCTAFGAGKLIDAYRAWSSFQRRYPNRYRARSSEELARIGTELTESTCACGDRGSLEREMRQFVRTFPTAPIAAAVRGRLRELASRRSNIRLRCLSG